MTIIAPPEAPASKPEQEPRPEQTWQSPSVEKGSYISPWKKAAITTLLGMIATAGILFGVT